MYFKHKSISFFICLSWSTVRETVSNKIVRNSTEDNKIAKRVRPFRMVR